GVGDPRERAEPHLPPARVRSRLPGLRLRRHHRIRAPRPRARGARAPGDGAPQPVPLGPLEDARDRGREAPRRRLRRGVLPAERRGGAVHPPRQGRPARPAPPPRAAAGEGAGHAVPGDRRPAAVRRHAARRGPGRVQGRDRLHQRRPDPQHRVLLAADDGEGDRGEDRHRRAALHRARPRPHRPSRRPARAREGPAAAGALPDIEWFQTYASGPMSEVDSIIWPNPEFDNNITVYGPEVKALVKRYLAQMIEELQALPHPDGGGRTLLDAIDLIVPS